MKETFTPEDLKLYQKAVQANAQAQPFLAVVNVINQHLAEVYNLGQGDTFDTQTGAITRIAAPGTDATPDPLPEAQ